MIKLTHHVKTLLMLAIINLCIVSCSTSISSGSSVDVVNKDVSVSAVIDPYRSIETVNGDIFVEKNAEVGFLKTINGDIFLEENVTVNENINTINGNVIIEKGSSIVGDINTMNGNIELQDANVSGNVITQAGNINASGSIFINLNTISGNINIDNSLVTGDINVRKSRLHVLEILSPVSWFFPQKVIIGSNSEVRGSINIAPSKVELYVHNSSSIANLVGPEVTIFSNEEP